jgi:hypothetical protein
VKITGTGSGVIQYFVNSSAESCLNHFSVRAYTILNNGWPTVPLTASSPTPASLLGPPSQLDKDPEPVCHSSVDPLRFVQSQILRSLSEPKSQISETEVKSVLWVDRCGFCF